MCSKMYRLCNTWYYWRIQASPGVLCFPRIRRDRGHWWGYAGSAGSPTDIPSGERGRRCPKDASRPNSTSFSCWITNSFQTHSGFSHVFSFLQISKTNPILQTITSLQGRKWLPNSHNHLLLREFKPSSPSIQVTDKEVAKFSSFLFFLSNRSHRVAWSGSKVLD